MARLSEKKPKQRKTLLKMKTKSTIFVWSMLALPLLNLLVFWVYVNIDAIFITDDYEIIDTRK